VKSNPVMVRRRSLESQGALNPGEFVPTIVPAAERTLSVFEVFAQERRELSNAALSKLLQVSDSSASDLLFTLEKRGYLMRTAVSRLYYPTGLMLTHTTRIAENDPLLTVGREAVELLAQRTGESAFFGRLDRNAAKVVAVREGNHPLRYVLKVGERIALHASGIGKGILGAMGPEEASRHLRLKQLSRVTEHTILDPAALEQELIVSRARGWYQVRQEGSEGADGLAVSGYLNGEPVALSVVGPSDRVEGRRAEYLDVLRELRSAVFGLVKS